MLGYWVDENGSEGRTIIFLDEDENGPIERIIPIAAIANRRETLGFDDPIEALEALIYIQRHGEPEPDGEGCQVWTNIYTALRHREQERERAALSADKDDRVEAGAIAAYNAVHQPIRGGDCLLDRLRAHARISLGLRHPSRSCGQETRTSPAVVHPPTPAPFGPMTLADNDRNLMERALQGEESYMQRCTQIFLHSLTDNASDPIAAETTSRLPSVRDLLHQYQQEAS